MRGFLALGVFFNHAAVYPHYLRDGSWWTECALCAQLGALGVSLFFMITAFLFYGRLIDRDGRPDWLPLYIGRVFRIGPVYLLAVAGMFAVVAAADFRLKVSVSQLTGEVLGWLALGAAPGGDINLYPDTRHLLAGVTWTLQSEWLFYASLPLLALATRRGTAGHACRLMPMIGLALVLTFLALFAVPSFPACLGPFFAGMCCAGLPRLPWARSRLGSSVAALALLIFFGAGLDPRGAPAILLLAGCFWLFVSGCSLFGLLTCRPAQWLGALSYGIYMLHGLLLSRLCAIEAVRSFALSSTVAHWTVMLGALGPVIAVAGLAHVAFEKPGIRLGAMLARRLKSPRPRSASVPAPAPAALPEANAISPPVPGAASHQGAVMPSSAS